jgi:hypothetical protein
MPVMELMEFADFRKEAERFQVKAVKSAFITSVSDDRRGMVSIILTQLIASGSKNDTLLRYREEVEPFLLDSKMEREAAQKTAEERMKKIKEELKGFEISNGVWSL